MIGYFLMLSNEYLGDYLSFKIGNSDCPVDSAGGGMSSILQIVGAILVMLLYSEFTPGGTFHPKNIKGT